MKVMGARSLRQMLSRGARVIGAASLLLSPLTGVTPVPAWSQTELFSYSVFQTWSVGGERLTVTAFSTDGRWLAFGTQSGKVGVVEAASGSAVRMIAQHSGGVTALAFSRAGTQLASSGLDGLVLLTELPGGQGKPLAGHKGKAWSVSFSPEGEFLASTGEDRSIIVWNPGTGRELFRLNGGGGKPLKHVGFINKGTILLAVSEDGTISEWDAKSRSRLRQMQESDKTVLSAGLDFASRYLTLGTQFMALQKGVLMGSARPTDLYRESRVKLYNVETGKVDKTLDHIDGEVKSISMSPDGRYVTIVRDRIKESYFGVFDVQRGVEIASLPSTPGRAASVAFSPDGRWLGAAADNGDLTLLAVKGVRPSGSMTDLAGIKYQITSSREPLIPSNTTLVVAVMDLDAQQVEPGIARAVSDMLRNRIAGTSRVDLVDRQRIDQILKEQNLQNSDRTDSATAIRIGRILNARKIIFGSVSKLGTSMTISTQMIDVETARIDGIRELLCQQCNLEDLPPAIAEFKAVLIADSP